MQNVDIHPTALVSPNAIIGEGTSIGPYSVIEDEVTIGTQCTIHNHVVITGKCKIGKNNTFHSHSVIGGLSQDLKYSKEPTYLEIGDSNNFREFVTINRGTEPESKTVVGSNENFVAYSHIAHDCVLGNDIVLTNQAALAGSVHVGDGAILGGYAIVHQFCSLGSYSFCAMGSAVNKDIPAYVKVRGNPAKPFGINVTGIKRLGYSKESIEALRSAYRSIYRKKLTVDEAIEELKELRKEHEEVNLFLDSIEKSTRGISR